MEAGVTTGAATTTSATTATGSGTEQELGCLVGCVDGQVCVPLPHLSSAYAIAVEFLGGGLLIAGVRGESAQRSAPGGAQLTGRG